MLFLNKNIIFNKPRGYDFKMSQLLTKKVFMSYMIYNVLFSCNFGLSLRLYCVWMLLRLQK